MATAASAPAGLGAQPAPVRAPSVSPEERAAYNALPNGPGSGPYPAVMEVDPALAAHVVYRPADLSAMGHRKLGVLVWGNGGCRDDGASARQHLLEIASYGYLVVAPGRILSGPGATEKPAERQPDTNGKLPPVATTAADVRAGLDWALAENRRKGSRYFGRIDPAATAVAGHSCGGLQAMQVAGDPRIHAVLVHNSGVFADGSNPIQGITVDKSLLKTLHTPVIYFLGGPSDVAYPNGSDDFRKIDQVPAVLVNLPVGHGGTFYRANGGAVAAAAVDWLEWQLRGDRTAARTFIGANCRLCSGPGWTIERKGFR
jgi:dienelactone hydrolase